MNDLRRTARITGLAYLGLGITGALGFLFIRSQVIVAGDGVATIARLVENEGLARLGIAGELSVVVTQAITALYFYKLYRRVDGFAAGSIAAFGLMSSAAVLVGTVFSVAALGVALDAGPATGDAGALVLALTELTEAAWLLGNVFFGLWLIPMGRLVLRSGYQPRPLGWILIVGGVGYVADAYLAQLAPGAELAINLLPLPATVGELWMIGYLLTRGIAGDPGPTTGDHPGAGGATYSSVTNAMELRSLSTPTATT